MYGLNRYCSDIHETRDAVLYLIYYGYHGLKHTLIRESLKFRIKSRNSEGGTGFAK